MRIQSIEQNNCQRKNNVSFRALLIRKSAFNLIDALFCDSFKLATDMSTILKPAERAEFSGLALVRSEQGKLSEANHTGIADEVKKCLRKMKKSASESGMYTVQRIKDAIANKNLFNDPNFNEVPPKSYEELSDKVRELYSLKNMWKLVVHFLATS